MSDHLPPRAFRFGGFVLDVSAFQLRRHGRTINLERRLMELLMMLVPRLGEVITRDEIAARLWGRDVFIEVGSGINTVVCKIRRALRDNPDHPRVIQTVQGLQAEIGAVIARQIGIQLSVRRPVQTFRQTRNPEAYDL
jgi:DNA-binding winged helix-turn-helix (wHTH) protein